MPAPRWTSSTRLAPSRLRKSLAGAAMALSAAIAAGLVSLSARAENPQSSRANLPTGQVPGTNLSAGETSESAQAKTFRQTVQPFLRKYCVECHGQETHERNVNFEALKDFSASVGQRPTWEKVRKMLGTRTMPPADHVPRPSAAEAEAVLHWIEQAVFDLHSSGGNDPGHVTLRRLNRAEYNNTIRDLVGVALRPADEFPSDDVGNGFDNMGDVLSLSPLLLEKYLSAAESVASVALYGIDLKRPPVRELDNARLTANGSAKLVRKPYSRHKRFVLSSAGSIEGKFNCPLAGEYICGVAAASQAADKPSKIRVQLDGKTDRLFEVKGQGATSRYELRLALAKGGHSFRAEFLEPSETAAIDHSADRTATKSAPKESAPKGSAAKAGATAKPPDAKAAEPAGKLIFDRFEVEGPFSIDPHETGLAAVASRKRILFCTPGRDGSGCACV